MNCEKCNTELSLRNVCRLKKAQDGEIKYFCLICPKDENVNKVLLQKAYVDFCQTLQSLCENGFELNNALSSAHSALKWAEKAV